MAKREETLRDGTAAGWKYSETETVMAKREETLSDGTVVVRYWTVRHLNGGFVLPGNRFSWHTMRLYDTRQAARDVKRPLFERVKKVWVEE